MKTSRLLLLLLACTHSAVAEKPNIVLLFADDLGYGDLSANGNPLIRTPNLDALAADGLRLTSFYSAPSCVPARTQLLLGRYPSRVNLGGTGSGGSGGIPEDEVTLAQALKAAGYRTGMMGKWHLGYARDEYLPVGRGFDYWFGLPYSNDMQPPWVKTDVPLWLYENTRKIEHPVDQDTLTIRYTERAVDFIEQAGDAPFFLYLAYAMPHLPIHTAESFQGRSRAGLLGDVVETLDWSAGEIVAALRRLGKLDNTIVIFTSDNGPWLNLPPRMLQQGNLPWHAGSPGPFRGAKHTTYEGGVRMPFVIRWPGQTISGRTSPEIAATPDLYVSLVQAGGGELPDHEIDGYDLGSFFKGETQSSPRREFFYHRGRELQAVRVGPWKLRQVGDQTELFHLELDPSERYNRADEMPAKVKELSDRLNAMRRETS